MKRAPETILRLIWIGKFLLHSLIIVNKTTHYYYYRYAEFPKTQEIIARDTCTVNKLLFMVDSRLDQDTAFYSLYSSEIAANTLFCCTCSLLTPEIFVQRNVHGKMMELTEKLLEGNYDLALRYCMCVGEL